MSWKSLKKTALTQADGAQTFDLLGFEMSYHHQLQIVLSATPTAGTLTVSARTPGATAYVDIGTIDMTGTDLINTFDVYADSVKITPASFDAAKTYIPTLFMAER